jgi:plastocyanin
MRAAGFMLALFAPAGFAAAATHVVTVEGMKFQPARVTVKRGDKVVWHNKDVVPHTVTAADRFNSRQIDGGKSWSWIAGAKGRYDYVCLYHPGMRATLVVE